MRNNDSNKGFGFSSVAANVQAYQAKLLEMAQANMQFALEFAQRLATVRSPVEILSVIAEFTSKRIAMFQRYSVEIAALSTVVVSPTSKMDWTLSHWKRSETGVGHPS
jgi:Phasin protein